MDKKEPEKIFSRSTTPGYQVIMVEPKEMPGDDPEGFTTKAMVTRLYDQNEEGPPIKAILLTRGVSDEAVAHEIGHSQLGHIDLNRSGDDALDDFVDEFEAWMWAQQRRGRSLKTDWVLNVIGQVSSHYLERSPEELTNLASRALSELGMRGMSKKQKIWTRNYIRELRD